MCRIALVTDDRRARRTAQARGLRVVGTVWVLERAAEQELIDLPPVLARLLTTNIRIHPDVIQEALARDAARKAGSPGAPYRTTGDLNHDHSYPGLREAH